MAWRPLALSFSKLAMPYGCGVVGECPTTALFDHYVSHANKTGAKRRSIETRLGKFLRSAVPGLTKRETKYKKVDKGFVIEERGFVYEFPDLGTCRKAFEVLLQQEFKWEELEGWRLPELPD